MKTLFFVLTALCSLSAFAQDVEELDVERLSLVVKRTLKIPGPADYNELLPIKAGLPAVKGKPACALSAIPAEIQLTRLVAGSTYGVQGIIKDPFSDSQTYIIAPDGIWGLGISCVKKLKSIDPVTGTMIGAKIAAPLLLGELREALKGVIEVRYQ